MSAIFPQTIYFVQKRAEHLSFIGHMVRIAALGFNLGLDVMLVTKNVPANAPPAFSQPGVWVQYSDEHFEMVGDGM